MYRPEVLDNLLLMIPVYVSTGEFVKASRLVRRLHREELPYLITYDDVIVRRMVCRQLKRLAKVGDML